MPAKWDKDDRTFHLGINMAGAVSAGAYTAGVLDFLMEALEEWQKQKDAGAAVPMHNVSIDVFSGASAGGMCAAIAAAMTQDKFDHIRDTSVSGTSNRFFESWVNRIDIEPLLQQEDIKSGNPLTSLLDSSIIDTIASEALTPGEPKARPYISKSLNLYLAVSNVRGIPFSLNNTGDASAQEIIDYYADRVQFQIVQAGDPAPEFPAKPLPAGVRDINWRHLEDAAKATGAFPIFLAPRQLERVAGDYYKSPWSPVAIANPPEVPPAWTLQRTDPINTLNVDGGLTDNDPFQLAHDFLAIRNPSAQPNPATGALENPRSATAANCAVLTVAPFPQKNPFNDDYNFNENSKIGTMLSNLINVLISQSRFFGESLSAVAGQNSSSSRFVIAPSEPGSTDPNQSALQCAPLQAFAGFLERGFRAHDYQLGRRNCQQFLKMYFRLDAENAVIKPGLANLTADQRKPFDPDGSGMIQIIPICGSAVDTVAPPVRAQITEGRIAQVVAWAVKRAEAVVRVLLEDAIGPGVKDWLARNALDALIEIWGKSKLKDLLHKELKGMIAPTADE